MISTKYQTVYIHARRWFNLKYFTLNIPNWRSPFAPRDPRPTIRRCYTRHRCHQRSIWQKQKRLCEKSFEKSSNTYRKGTWQFTQPTLILYQVTDTWQVLATNIFRYVLRQYDLSKDFLIHMWISFMSGENWNAELNHQHCWVKPPTLSSSFTNIAELNHRHCRVNPPTLPS